MLCFTIGDVGSSLAQAYLPAFYRPAAAEGGASPGRRPAPNPNLNLNPTPTPTLTRTQAAAPRRTLT